MVQQVKALAAQPTIWQSQDPHSGEKEVVPASCSLTPTHAHRYKNKVINVQK